MVIVIEKDKSMKLNQDPIEESKLGQRLIEVFKTRAERVVFVKGDPDLDFADRGACDRHRQGRGHRQDRPDDAQDRGRPVNRPSNLTMRRMKQFMRGIATPERGAARWRP